MHRKIGLAPIGLFLDPFLRPRKKGQNHLFWNTNFQSSVGRFSGPENPFLGPGFETTFQEVKKVVNLPLIYSNFWVRGGQTRYRFFRSSKDLRFWPWFWETWNGVIFWPPSLPISTGFGVQKLRWFFHSSQRIDPKFPEFQESRFWALWFLRVDSSHFLTIFPNFPLFHYFEANMRFVKRSPKREKAI